MNHQPYVTQSDINSIDHFLVEKGDITRWTGWEDLKAGIDSAWDSLGNALKTAASRFK